MKLLLLIIITVCALGLGALIHAIIHAPLINDEPYENNDHSAENKPRTLPGE